MDDNGTDDSDFTVSNGEEPDIELDGGDDHASCAADSVGRIPQAAARMRRRGNSNRQKPSAAVLARRVRGQGSGLRFPSAAEVQAADVLARHATMNRSPSSMTTASAGVAVRAKRARPSQSGGGTPN